VTGVRVGMGAEVGADAGDGGTTQKEVRGSSA
jgi:hypothetical protein